MGLNQKMNSSLKVWQIVQAPRNSAYKQVMDDSNQLFYQK